MIFKLSTPSRTGRDKLRLRLLRQLRPWHRRLGLISVLFILLVLTTGVAINHSDDLQLARRPVTQGWLLDHYGIKAPTHLLQFESQTALTITDNLLWLGDRQVLEAGDKLIAAAVMAPAAAGADLLAIDAQHLYLLGPDGELLETQSRETGLPVPLQALATVDGQVWLKTPKGYYLGDAALIDWRQAQPFAPIDWQAPMAEFSRGDLVQRARGAHLNWERVLLDLHSGRLFGAPTVWLWDLFALALALVSLSGLWIWFSQKPPRR